MASFWGSLDGASAQHVARVSRRVLALHQLLGGKDDIDIVWMIEREPDLLVADLSVMTARLVELRTADGCAGIDVVKLAEQHPSLLLSNELASDGEESAAQRQAAWAHGLLGDGDTAWARRLEQLEAYGAAHGDVHVGHRDGDDAELVRWAGKQRKDHKKGELASDRRERLHAVGFEFDDERAEWLRWYNELKAFEAVSGHCTPVPLAAGADFLLINWCAVQRIARRSGVMPEDRKAMLDVLGFDWSGADPLS